MLADSKCVATVATADVAAARAFYVDKLGLKPQLDSEDGLGFILPDGSGLMVYHRPGHSAPENTAVTFVVADARAEVAELQGRGVTFQDYDLPESGIKTVDGIASDPDGGAMAWCKDPAGNILGIMTMPPGAQG